MLILFLVCENDDHFPINKMYKKRHLLEEFGVVGVSPVEQILQVVDEIGIFEVTALSKNCIETTY